MYGEPRDRVARAHTEAFAPRFGHARNDDADLSELAPGAAIESGGDQAGMGRGEAPRKPKSREK